MTEVTASHVSQASSANKIYLRKTIFYYRGLYSFQLIFAYSKTTIETVEKSV